jgi:hypothetical protein
MEGKCIQRSDGVGASSPTSNTRPMTLLALEVNVSRFWADDPESKAGGDALDVSEILSAILAAILTVFASTR